MSLLNYAQEKYNAVAAPTMDQQKAVRVYKAMANETDPLLRKKMLDYLADEMQKQLHPMHVYKDDHPNSPAQRRIQIRQTSKFMPEQPQTYDHARNSLTALGALCLRLQARRGMPYHSGEMLPNIQHINAHVVYPRNEMDFGVEPATAAYVFIVNGKGEAITLEDPHPTLFPSDTLVLQVQTIMEGSK